MLLFEPWKGLDTHIYIIPAPTITRCHVVTSVERVDRVGHAGMLHTAMVERLTIKRRRAPFLVFARAAGTG